MATSIQIAIDCRDPHALARFWAAALGYETEDHRALVDELLAAGRLSLGATVDIDDARQFRDVSACRDPDGAGPRLFFQSVPEAKTVKNRVHLDLHAGAKGVESETARLEGLGARRLWYHDDRGGPCWTLADIEGNEFCVH